MSRGIVGLVGCSRWSWWSCPSGRAGFAGGLGVAALFAGAGLALWLAAGVAQRLLLFGRGLRQQVRHGNHAAAWATAANQVAIAVVIPHAVYGDRLGELPAAVAFAALGLVTWAVFVALFRAVTTYPDGQEIAGENQAAALSYAGSALALAAIIGHALDGPFAGWRRSFGCSLPPRWSVRSPSTRCASSLSAGSSWGSGRAGGAAGSTTRLASSAAPASRRWRRSLTWRRRCWRATSRDGGRRGRLRGVRRAAHGALVADPWVEQAAAASIRPAVAAGEPSSAQPARLRGGIHVRLTDRARRGWSQPRPALLARSASV